MSEGFRCMICTEIMFMAVTLMPCLHSFCGPCYSGWMERSHECPFCREKVKSVKKNATLNSMIEQYLKMHPDEDRVPEEKELLKKANKITAD